ncbi:MAG: hypothetical protein ACYDIB_00820 [Desulfobulbia bacterium]
MITTKVYCALSQLLKHKERKRTMKSVKTTVALALMLLLSTGMIACKKAEEAEVAAPAEQTAPAPEVVVAPQAEPGASTVVVVPPAEQAAPAEAAPADAAAPAEAPAAK